MVTPDTEHNFLETVLLGDQDAIEIAVTLGEASQLMDDIIDGDKTLLPVAVASTFLRMLTLLPTNQLYIRHAVYLSPLLYTAVCDYLASTKMEKTSNEHAKNLAFVLRDNLVSVVIYLARCVGGDLYGMEVAQSIREFYHDETLEEYKGALR